MNILSEKSSKIILFTGIGIFILSIFLFSWNDWNINTNSKINSEKFNQFGSFISGVIGSLWSLAGIILFYVALKDQRTDFSNNREALKTQVEALKQQIKEFELQRLELEQTRNVFLEQTNTQKYQRFENTFFQLLSFHSQIVSNMDLQNRGDINITTTGIDCFKKFLEKLDNDGKKSAEKDRTSTNSTSIISVYNNTFFPRNQSNLGHYFRHLYHIIKFVKFSGIDENDKKKYTSLVRAQLSSYELCLLYYNGLSKYGNEKFKPLIEEYSLLKNIDKDLLLKNYNFSQNENYAQKAFGKSS